jgi:hypothetical protein
LGNNNPRIFFVTVSFADENSIFASNAWLHGINSDLSPKDDVAGSRYISCDVASRHSCAGQERTTDAFCKRASIGHPNVTGAQKYADAIKSFL